MLKLLDRLEEVLITVLMGAATLLIFVAVAHRYAAGMSIPGVQDALLKIDLSWAQELCIYMFNRLPPDTRKFYVLFGLLAGAAFTGIVGTLGATFTWDIAHTDSVSPDLELPKWIVYLCIPLGSYLMCFRFLQVAWSFWRTGDLPHHDVAHVEGIDAPNVVPGLHPAEGVK